jgi:hypothetical protein
MHPMNKTVRGVLASGGGFLAGYFLPTIAFMVVYFISPRAGVQTRDPVFEQTLMVLYLAGVYALAGCIAYAAITAASRNWRERAARRVAPISALMGVIAQLLNWTGLSFIAALPVMRMFPGKVGNVVSIAMPGVIVGVAVLIWAVARKPAAPPGTAGADGPS